MQDMLPLRALNRQNRLINKPILCASVLSQYIYPLFHRAPYHLPLPKVLTGVVVSRGDGKPYTGVARVVTGTDISNIEFNEGDILVTINSSPVYLPLIKKAGALLSEEGGMACHTAVVARELGKIGITSIKNATSTIHTGQSIVVDVLVQEIRTC